MTQDKDTGRWASEGGADPQGPATDVPADDNEEKK